MSVKGEEEAASVALEKALAEDAGRWKRCVCDGTSMLKWQRCRRLDGRGS